MSRTSFFSRSSSSREHDQSPLLYHNYNDDADSVSLQNLSPREAESRTVSPSPPPSFYRDLNTKAGLNDESLPAFLPSSSTSPSRSRNGGGRGGGGGGKRIQFAAPPPPIVGSVLLPPSYEFSGSRTGSVKGNGKATDQSFHGTARSMSPQIRRGSGGIDPLLGLERREKAIHAELQSLLDAQSAGLVQGFGGNSGKDGSSDAGSSTPTTRSLSMQRDARKSAGGVTPVRQPKRKIVGLRGARRGLLRDIGELVAVKSEEVGVLDNEIGRRKEVLERVSEWERRIEGARAQLSAASGVGKAENAAASEEAMEIAELRTEEVALDNEIREMEDRLLQMKARKRWLGERIKESTNKQEARLSSYRGALREVESEVKQFLKRPPIPVSVVMGNEESFTALPSSRRTLGMAKEWWNKEVDTLQARKANVEKEKEALQEGAEIWQQSIDLVIEFEDDLRRQMASNDAQGADMLQRQVVKMGDVIGKLESSMRVAEEKGWNLLICAVGAELEAFKEGEGILKGALAVLQPPESERGDRRDHHESDSLVDSRDGDEDIHGHGEEESRHDMDTDSVLNELNKGVDVEILSHGAASLDGTDGRLGYHHGRASLDREESVSDDDGPDLAELMVDRS